VICAIYDAMVHLRTPDRAAERLAEARDRARAAGEPGLERLARGFRLVPLRMLGHVEGLEDEVEALLRPDTGREYDRYLCLWASSLLALVDRAGPRLRRLMDEQLADLAANGIRGNWLTMYWEALALVLTGEEYLPQLRRARLRAEAEGRRADADCALVLAYAAACDDDWEQAAELLGAVGDALLRDTAGFIHLALVREQLVRPRLDPEVFAAATARGQALDLDVVLAAHGL
jgi:hypothetical protein